MSTLTSVNPWLPKKIPANTAIYVIPQDSTFYPENTDEAADLTKVPDTKWKNLARVQKVQYQQETEDDAEEAFDAVTHTLVSEKNTYIKTRTWNIDLTRYSLIFEAMMHGVANPLADETIAKMSAGEKLPIFRSNDPNIPVGVKMELWDRNQNKQLTRYFYATLKASGELTVEGKILRPSIALELQSSVWSYEETTTDFTGQTEAED